MIAEKIAEGCSPFFSVVVPVYNKEPHIARAINSILNQTFQDFEVIIVCDPSTDNSNAEVAKFKDPRIRVLHRDEPGPGGYAARNLGIKEAQGEWIAFLDADDEWCKENLEVAVDLVQSDTEVLLVTSSWSIVKKGIRDLDGFSKNLNLSSSKKITLDDYMNGPRPIWTGVVRAKADLIRKIGLFDERWCHGADKQYWFRLFLEARDRIIWSPKVSAVYHTDSGNMVTQNLSQFISPTSDFIFGLTKESEIDADTVLMLRRYSNKCQMRPFLRYVVGGNPLLPYLKKNFY